MAGGEPWGFVFFLQKNGFCVFLRKNWSFLLKDFFFFFLVPDYVFFARACFHSVGWFLAGGFAGKNVVSIGC